MHNSFSPALAQGWTPTGSPHCSVQMSNFEIAGDVGALPWIGRQTGRSAASDLIRDTRRLIEQRCFDVHDVLASHDRAVIVVNSLRGSRRPERPSTQPLPLSLPSPMARSLASRCWRTASRSLGRQDSNCPLDGTEGIRTRLARPQLTHRCLRAEDLEADQRGTGLKPGRYRSRQRIIGPVACRRVRYPAHGPLNAPPLAFVIREVQHLRYDTRHQKC